MPNITEATLNHNLRIYGWVRMLGARVYLPVIAIYAAEACHLNLAQIGTLTAIGAVVSLLANVPTGYFADRRTRRAALMTGSVIIIASTLSYVLFPSYPGAIAAVMFDALGYAFLSGAGEALIHDTLAYLGRSGEYVKVMGRAQSMSMAGNVVLVGLVPLTYALDKRLPFLCGAVTVACFLMVARSLVEPPRPARTTASNDDEPGHARRLGRALHQFVNRRSIMLFWTIGLLSASYISYTSFTQLATQDLGLDPGFMGVMYASSSLVAAAAGWHIHRLNRLPLLQYALLDVVIASGYALVIGLTHSLPIAIAGFIINMSFWRFRGIIYQDLLLRRFGHHHHKATLISTMGFFSGLQQLWLPVVFAAIIGAQGYYAGLTAIGVGILVVVSLAFVVANWAWQYRPQERKLPA